MCIWSMHHPFGQNILQAKKVILQYFVWLMITDEG